MEGNKRVDKQLDVTNLFKAMRKVDLLTRITLSRHQRHFLPVLRENVLDVSMGDPPDQNHSDNQGEFWLDDSKTKQYLK